MSAKRVVVDAVHGDVHLTDREWRILDTPSFQRLRRLKQLGMAHVTYPNATHTRFAHSLGALGIMGRIVEVAQSNGFHLEQRQWDNLRLAALLHDIGHYPYSHLMERLDSVRLTEEEIEDGGPAPEPFDVSGSKYPSHKELGALIVTNQPDLLKAIGDKGRAREISDLFVWNETADRQLSKLIHSSLDMDRLDYLQRDSHAAGVPYGNIDINYLLNCLKISQTGMVGVLEKALPAAEQFLLARFFMHRTVYYHKTTFGMEEACRQLLRRVRDVRKYEVPVDGNAVREMATSQKLLEFTDAFVDNIVLQAAPDDDPVIGSLAKAVRDRRPPKLLKEVSVFTERSAQHHAGTTFWLKCKVGLERLADDFSIPIGQFLLAKTSPLSVEPRPALLTSDQARALPPEDKDELIKVFVGEEPEPRSLVDIEHSLIPVCAGKFFQSFRLYVVYEGKDKDKIVSDLHEQVHNWDSVSP